MNKMTTYDVVIVGAGILGLSAAIQAAEQNLKVCVFEKDPTPMGATRRNFGMVGSSTLARPDDEWRDYVLDTLAFYQGIQAKHALSFQQRSGLYLANSTAEWQVLQEFSAVADQHGIEVEQLSPTQLAQQYAYLKPQQDFQGALRCVQDYSVEPEHIAAALISYARQLGVHVQCNATVIETRAHAGRCMVKLAGAVQVDAAKVLICHGDVVNLLYPQQLQQLGLQRCALQMSLTEVFAHQVQSSIYSGLSIARYPAFEICPSHAALKNQVLDPLVQAHGIHVLVKQNHLGQLLIGDSHDYTDLDQAANFSQREAVNDWIYHYCRSAMGIQLPAIQQRWTGYYLSHPQQPACVTEAESNIYLVSAIAGKGMTTGAGFMKRVLEQHIY